jgi:hypothetical protein
MADSAPQPADQWGRRLFTVGGVWLLLLGAVHSLSFFNPLAPANETERQLLTLMTGYKFNLMGSLRSMDNLLTGFSVAFMLAALVLGALALALRRQPAPLLKRVALLFAVWLVAMVVVSLNYFFALPLAFLIIGLLLFAGSCLTLPARS